MTKEVIPLVADDELDPTFADYVAERKRRRSWVANNTYALANAPELGMAARNIFDAVQTIGSLPRELRYLIRYVVSNANACRYCMTHQVNFLRHEFGVSLERLRAATSAEESPLFTDGEKAALAYAKALTLGAGSVPDRVYEDLARHFTPKERVEITVVAAAMNMINIVNDGLRIPLEEEALLAFAS
jgi:alkylhydroperoxidase family enzyme